MKFAYIDESGDAGQGDVFTMAGILIDATKLRKWTIHFDQKLARMLARNPKQQAELKTKQFIDGGDKWGKAVPGQQRQNFLREICEDVVKCAEIYAYGMSFKGLKQAQQQFASSKQDHYWVASAMFIACLIQKHQANKNMNKGNTVLIFDHNSKGMPGLSENIFSRNDWYDGLYAKKASAWRVKPSQRFSQIINSGFSIDSRHSSLIQVADILCYIYRRHLELASGTAPQYPQEQSYYSSLVAILDSKRQKLKQCPSAPVVDFYKQAKHDHWEI